MSRSAERKSLFRYVRRGGWIVFHALRLLALAVLIVVAYAIYIPLGILLGFDGSEEM